MGLLEYGKFSSIPTFLKRVRERQRLRELQKALIGLAKSEWIISEGIRKTPTATDISATANTIYTVPVGKIAYLYFVSISYLTTGVLGGSAVLGISGVRLISLKAPLVADQTDSQLGTFSPGIRLDEGETVIAQSTSASVEVDVGVLIYEIDERSVESRI